jgi:uncharacterized lipoprotein
VNPIFKLTLLGAAISLTACGTLDAGKVDYRSATSVKAPSLDVPPDLTQLSKNTHYAVVGGHGICIGHAIRAAVGEHLSCSCAGRHG